MLAALVTLALFGSAIAMLTQMVRQDARKILAALQGNSWTAESPATGPVAVRFSPRYPVSQPMRARPALRVAA
jgi:hypothetical protein